MGDYMPNGKNEQRLIDLIETVAELRVMVQNLYSKIEELSETNISLQKKISRVSSDLVVLKNLFKVLSIAVVVLIQLVLGSKAAAYFMKLLSP